LEGLPPGRIGSFSLERSRERGRRRVMEGNVRFLHVVPRHQALTPTLLDASAKPIVCQVGDDENVITLEETQLVLFICITIKRTQHKTTTRHHV
jgi:hypothetical protein